MSKERNRFIKLLFIGMFFIISHHGYSQSEEITLSNEYDHLSWIDFINKIESEYPVNFYYHPDSIPDIIIELTSEHKTLRQVLTDHLKPHKIEVSWDDNGNIFLAKNNVFRTSLPDQFFNSIIPDEKPSSSNNIPNDNYLQTKAEFVAKTIIVGSSKNGLHKKNATILGRLTHSKDGNPIIGGTLYLEELQSGTITDEQGLFTLEIPKGDYILDINSLESKRSKFHIQVLSDGVLDIVLEQRIYLLDEVEILSEKHHYIRGTQMGYEKLTAKKVKEIPMVLGEKDIVKVALLLPGVQTVGEGASGFNVRGSPADQNLFYINSTPIYNTSHLFGFFSAFNPDVVNEFTLYKSNIPAQYGGRLASIFDIKTGSGKKEKFSIRGGISPITGRLLIEGPLKKDKCDFMIGVRSTYSDWLLKFAKEPDIQNSSAQFADAVTTLSYNLNNSNQLKLFTYNSTDAINLAQKTEHSYQNTGISLAWYNTYKNKRDLSVKFIYSDYRFNENNKELEIAAYRQAYELTHNEAKIDYVIQATDNHTVSMGINSILYQLNQGTHSPLNDQSFVIEQNLGEEKGLESGIFIDDEWEVSSKINLQFGLRYNLYSYLGPNQVYTYPNNIPRIADNISDTLYFDNNELIKSSGGLDYRFAATFLLHEHVSLKMSYNKLHQYIFMLSNSIALSPNARWKLADYNICPMVGDQFSLGIFTNLFGEYIQTSIEAYYKNVNNLIEYKDGAELIVTTHPETEILQGKLDSYGIELMLKKPYGRLNGWLNYTYSSATVLVNDQLRGENNNFGIAYPTNYDKPHAINLVINYKISRRFNFSGNLVYSTGRPITYPTAIYYQNGQKILHYSNRNEYRLPDYFRIDASLNIEGNLLSKKLAHGSFSFSVYNLTGRKNAYSVYFKSENGSINGYKLSIFGNQIFSIGYNFKLGNYDD
ncbi:MAG: TonB-dependent receptor [Bacteroidales bacterium]|nr:TonB-dependent receptor [Bacteroidales bacterium]